MIGQGLREIGRDPIECLVPAGISAADLRVQQSTVGSERVTERGALRAEATAVGGVVGVSRDDSVRRDAQPATDAAIRTGGADHAACHCGPAAAFRVSASDIAAISTCGTAAPRSAK